MAIIVPKNFSDQRLIVNPGVVGDADDLSAYSASATLVNSPTVTKSGIELNGTNQYITHPDAAHNSLFSANQITLFTWFNADTVDAVDQILIAKNDGGDNNKSYKLFIDATTDKIQSVISSDGSADSSDISSAGTITAGSDVYAVMTYDGERHRIYIDGVEDASGFYNGGIFDGDETVSLGADFSTGTAQLFFDGTIRQAGVLGTALQSHEVLSRFLLGPNFPLDIEPKQLLLHENFRGGGVPRDWTVDSGGTFSVEFDNTASKFYLACLAGTDVTLKITTPNWSGSNFADTQTTVAGTPTVTRNTGDVTLTMSAGDDMTDVVVRRN